MNILADIRKTAYDKGVVDTQREVEEYSEVYDEGFRQGLQYSLWLFRGLVMGFVIGVGLMCLYFILISK